LYTNHGILIGKGNEALVKACWRQVQQLSDVVPILV